MFSLIAKVTLPKTYYVPGAREEWQLQPTAVPSSSRENPGAASGPWSPQLNAWSHPPTPKGSRLAFRSDPHTGSLPLLSHYPGFSLACGEPDCRSHPAHFIRQSRTNALCEA